MRWMILHLRAESEFDERLRKGVCHCGLRRCTHCNGFYEAVQVTKLGTCPLCAKPDDSSPIQHGEPLWPGKWHCVALAEKKFTDATVWESSYQGKPSVGGGLRFAATPPPYYEKIDTSKMNVYLIVDPALCRTKISDRVAIGVFGCHEDQNYYVLDGIVGRMSTTERANHVFRLHRKWRPLGVGYEEYGLQTDVAELRRLQEEQNYRFQIIELGRTGEWHNISKNNRINTLEGILARGRMWLPNPETVGRAPELVAYVKMILEEWLKWPACSFDDWLDMTSRLNDPAMRVTFPTPKRREAQEPYKLPAGCTWMGA